MKWNSYDEVFLKGKMALIIKDKFGKYYFVGNKCWQRKEKIMRLYDTRNN